jgi:hypothetical protein
MESKSLSDSVLKAAIEQFTANINHRQTLFIQFFLGVVVAIAGYSYIYTNTDQTAFFWSVRRGGDLAEITSYSISSLVGSYIIAQSVLILLGRFILSSGYSYRKYQSVIYNIRRKSLGSSFTEYFANGDKEFSPYNKNGCFTKNSYLPEFETIFFVFIWALQVVLLGSIILKMGTFHHPFYIQLAKPTPLFFIYGQKVVFIRFWVLLLAALPLLFTCHFQSNYYCKYLKKVFSAQQTNPDNSAQENTANALMTMISYKRRISLAWGYMLLTYLCHGLLIVFVVIYNQTSLLYLEPFEACILLISSSLLYSFFLYNLLKAFFYLQIHTSGTSESKKMMLRQIRPVIYQKLSGFFFRRTTFGRTIRVIPVMAYVCYLSSFITVVVLLLKNPTYRSLVGGFVIINLFITWLLLRPLRRPEREVLTMAQEEN